LRIPSVTLFGPTPPALWGPPQQRPWHVVLWTGRSGDPHGRRPDAGRLAIESAAVIAALARLDLSGAALKG
jgi:ADP-heptose:LPS heptosyltransferase